MNTRVRLDGEQRDGSLLWLDLHKWNCKDLKHLRSDLLVPVSRLQDSDVPRSQANSGDNSLDGQARAPSDAHHLGKRLSAWQPHNQV